MQTFAVTVKGQVVIPSDIRHRYHIKKGTRVHFFEKGGEIVMRPLTDKAIDSMKGSMKAHGNALKALLEEKKFERER